MLFDIERAATAWQKLEPSKTYENGKNYSAWDRLVHYLKGHGIPQLDGGLLRVVALFGDNFIEYNECFRYKEYIQFQAGPCTYSIGSEIDSNDPRERYLLSRAGTICWDDEHLHRYIKSYMCAWHDKKRCPIMPRFDLLHTFLVNEIQMASSLADHEELYRLNQILSIMRLLADMSK